MNREPENDNIREKKKKKKHRATQWQAANIWCLNKKRKVFVSFPAV